MVIEIATRLREARTALGLTIEDFGALGGVTKQAQINYEKGLRSPDTKYLTALASAGVDIPYVLLGDKKLAVQVGVEELAVLDKYRHSKTDTQEAVKRLLSAEPLLKRALVTVINGMNTQPTERKNLD